MSLYIHNGMCNHYFFCADIKTFVATKNGCKIKEQGTKRYISEMNTLEITLSDCFALAKNEFCPL